MKHKLALQYLNELSHDAFKDSGEKLSVGMLTIFYSELKKYVNLQIEQEQDLKELVNLYEQQYELLKSMDSLPEDGVLDFEYLMDELYEVQRGIKKLRDKHIKEDDEV